VCGSLDKTGLAWQTNLPQEEGDYLWVEQWSCGCIFKSGIVWAVPDPDPDEDSDDFQYTADDGTPMTMTWQGRSQPTFHDGRPVIHHFLKLDIPVPEWPSPAPNRE
jgi:hypothetical protein